MTRPQSAPVSTVRLRDGRVLAYAEYGDPRGEPVLYFHGFPNSRLNAALGAESAARHGLRLIAFDRPGFGRSDFKARRSIGAWADDVAEAADQLGIDRFAVIALSGGGPYAAACAARIPHRLTGLALVSALGPLDVAEAVRGYRWFTRLTFRLWRRLPFLIRIAMWFVGRRARRDPEGLISSLGRSAPPADKAVLERPHVLAAFARDFAESFRQGSRAAAWEFRLYLNRWDFAIDQVPLEVHIWQGEADEVVPPSMARYYERVLPNAAARFFPNEGHLLIVDHIDQVNSALFPPRR